MYWLGPCLVVLGAFLWGVSGGLGGLLIDRGWGPLITVFYRGATGFLFVLVWLMWQPRQNLKIDSHLILWSILGGLGVTGNLTFYLISISEVGVAVAATLMYLAPVYVYLAAFLTGVERSTIPKWLAIGVTMLGIVLLTDVLNSATSTITLLGVTAGLLSGLCYALFIFVFKHAAARGGRPQTILSISLLSFTLLLLPFLDYPRLVAASLSSDVVWFILTGLFGAGIAFPVYFIGLRTTSPPVASVIAMIEPITAALMGVVILGETLSLLQLAGMVLILIPVTLLSTRRI
ncbi:Threonine/homoserine efflux transporter RhtA [Modicisalibacter ilicicola DSM 19980]|uniref:Threonine/homoserine efflux transporter RhtA n=1 Tax=Modicisalibacter ilicicola DSM 19980 TaxID=1121942 RepID=A0A1M5B034_9GAMM|nr:EamA family transporter [Halomonas ilicicola]SHF35810.1 Threonine/homoserine efflux transporter RhtA [Halomonas ilicicola DSM 19980]